MKVTFEFDTDSENFSYYELEQYFQSGRMLSALDSIKNQVRNWYKYDDRENIPVDEIQDKIYDCILDNGVDMEKMGY